MELSSGSSNKTKGSQEGEGPVDHVETRVQLMEAPELEKLTSRSGSCSVENSVEEIEILEVKVKSGEEGREDHEAEKSSVNKRQHQQHDDLQQVGKDEKEDGVLNLSPVKRRKRNLDLRREAIDKFEEEMINFVWDYLSANYADKFSSAGSLYQYSAKTVREKILQPEVSSYSKVIEQGGSWAEFQLNRAMKENVQRFVDEMM